MRPSAKDVTLALVPGEALDIAVHALPRRQRRLLLATITGAGTPRNRRLRRRLERSMAAR